LWIPNSIGLKGDYDWFFEGFTLYQELLTGLRLKHIKFDDYLETLGRVYASYRSATERDKLSLLEASERRWTTASTLVYDKGMLVALIYDLMLRRNSHGQASLTGIYPALLREAAGGGKDANELVMRVLDARPGLERFSEQYVQSTWEIDLNRELAPFGLEVTNAGSVPRITVSKNLNGEQRRLLKALGYKG
jgi:predicted metalloprotease with PDZ domain